MSTSKVFLDLLYMMRHFCGVFYFAFASAYFMSWNISAATLGKLLYKFSKEVYSLNSCVHYLELLFAFGMKSKSLYAPLQIYSFHFSLKKN